MRHRMRACDAHRCYLLVQRAIGGHALCDTLRTGSRPGGRAREIFFRGGAPGAPPAGRPGRPRGGRKSAPREAPNRAHFGTVFLGLSYYFVLEMGVPGGSRRGTPGGCIFGPPGRGAPRGAKKCTFFWVFNNSPSRDSLGPFFGPPRDPHFWPVWGWYPSVLAARALFMWSLPSIDRHHAQHAPQAMVGALGRDASDGYPLDGLTSNGWYVRPGRAPPSKQARKCAQCREDARRSQSIAIANRD